jgi:hypothetical protein
MNLNKNVQRSVAAMTAAGLLVPSFAFAQRVDLRTEVRAPGVRVEARAEACTNIGARLGGIETRLLDVRTRLDARHNDREQTLEKRRSDRASDVSVIRDNAEARRVQASARLEALADTDAERAAIVEFQADVRAAVEARQAAYAAANAAFRQGVDASATSRRTQAESSVSTFRAAIKAAIEKARTDCAAGKDVATIRADFAAAVKAAKDRFAASRTSMDRVGAQARALAETRKAAHVKAMADFRAAMEAARVDLKAAFAVEAEVETE